MRENGLQEVALTEERLDGQPEVLEGSNDLIGLPTGVVLRDVRDPRRSDIEDLALAANTNICKPVKTETVKKKVKVKVTKTVAGKRVTTTKTVTKKVTEQVAAPLLMPTEIIAQNGAVLKQSTKISVTGCKATKPAKKKKAKAKKKAKGKKK